MCCQLVYSVVIFSHRFLDSDCINFKTFAFLAVYWPFWTSLYSTDIKVQQFLNRSSTMLNNVFNVPTTFRQPLGMRTASSLKICSRSSSYLFIHLCFVHEFINFLWLVKEYFAMMIKLSMMYRQRDHGVVNLSNIINVSKQLLKGMIRVSYFLLKWILLMHSVQLFNVQFAIPCETQSFKHIWRKLRCKSKQ